MSGKHHTPQCVLYLQHQLPPKNSCKCGMHERVRQIMHLPAGVASGASAERVLEQLLAHSPLHHSCSQTQISHRFHSDYVAAYKEHWNHQNNAQARNLTLDLAQQLQWVLLASVINLHRSAPV